MDSTKDKNKDRDKKIRELERRMKSCKVSGPLPVYQGPPGSIDLLDTAVPLPTRKKDSSKIAYRDADSVYFEPK